MSGSHVTATLRAEAADYAVDLDMGGHRAQCDEGAELGGADRGPPPFGYVLAGLASCTAITLRMYAQRKAWPLNDIRVACHLTHEAPPNPPRVVREVVLTGPLDDAQRARLADVCEKTPVTKLLKTSTTIETHVR